MLLAHADPDGVVVGQQAPCLADLGGLGETDGVEIAEDLLRDLDGQGGDEVDFEGLRDFAGDERELGEAELGEDALQHQLAVTSRGGGEQRPHVGDGLLVGRRELVQLLLDVDHLGLVGGSSTFRVWAVPIAVLCVWFLLPRRLLVPRLPDGGVQAGDVFLQKRGDRLADQ